MYLVMNDLVIKSYELFRYEWFGCEHLVMNDSVMNICLGFGYERFSINFYETEYSIVKLVCNIM